jgi:hypothetical protein
MSKKGKLIAVEKIIENQKVRHAWQQKGFTFHPRF